MKFNLFSAGLLFASFLFAEDIESIVRRNQKAAVPQFPAAGEPDFKALQKAALSGDAAARTKLPSLFTAHLKSVYGILAKQGGLLFSGRRPVPGYDTGRNNYAVNIDEFFEAAAVDRRIRKFDFEVASKNQDVFQVSVLRYRPADRTIEVKNGRDTKWVALDDLSGMDQMFVQNALMDEMFESSNDFMITSEDSRPDEGSERVKGQVSFKSRDTGEQVEGSFVAASAKEVVRKIILQNKGSLPLENLAVEYQSFAEQTIMRFPKDFPSDYRVAGFFEIKTLAPGEEKELILTLPEVVSAKQTSIHTGEYEYTQVIPPDRNPASEGRLNGIWVRVHRFTPYGERLTREYKSAGVPSVEWDHIAFTGADIRK